MASKGITGKATLETFGTRRQVETETHKAVRWYSSLMCLNCSRVTTTGLCGCGNAYSVEVRVTPAPQENPHLKENSAAWKPDPGAYMLVYTETEGGRFKTQKCSDPAEFDKVKAEGRIRTIYDNFPEVPDNDPSLYRPVRFFLALVRVEQFYDSYLNSDQRPAPELLKEEQLTR